MENMDATGKCHSGGCPKRCCVPLSSVKPGECKIKWWCQTCQRFTVMTGDSAPMPRWADAALSSSRFRQRAPPPPLPSVTTWRAP
eukprot:3369277-Rhodomonas_salina.1